MRAGSARTAATLAVLCLAAALLLPAAVSAKGASIFPIGKAGPEFSLGKRGGMKLTVSTKGQKVRFAVEGKSQSITYEVPGRVSDGGIHASLGGAGKVDVDFEPSGPPEKVEPFPFCKGTPGTVTQGDFTGMIRFTGRGHFANFHATRVPGTLSKRGKLSCHLPGEHAHQHEGKGTETEPEEEEDKDIELTAVSPDKRLGFVAVSGPDNPGRFSLFAAISKEETGRIQISRLTLTASRRSSYFTFDEGLTMATVAPPAPFLGRAEFIRGAAGAAPSWSGNLRVAFLDRTMPLTGKGFRARLAETQKIGERRFRVP